VEQIIKHYSKYHIERLVLLKGLQKYKANR